MSYSEEHHVYATPPCSVSVFAQARPTMQCIHLVRIITIGGHTVKWNEPASQPCSLCVKIIDTWEWGLGLRLNIRGAMN